MTNTEMYEKFKLEGIPVKEGMTQVEMRKIKKNFESKEEEHGLVKMFFNNKEWKVQEHDVPTMLKKGFTVIGE